MDKKRTLNKSLPSKYSEDPFVETIVRIPRDLYNKTKDYKTIVKQPMSTVVSIALDNEIDCDNPFHYDCSPTTYEEEPYIEFKYAQEAKQLLDFLIKFPKGCAPELLMMCRREYGLEHRVDVRRALRELYETGQIELCAPTGYRKKLCDSSYRFWRVVGAERVPEKKRKRFKKIMGKGMIKQKYIKESEVEDEQK